MIFSGFNSENSTTKSNGICRNLLLFFKKSCIMPVQKNIGGIIYEEVLWPHSRSPDRLCCQYSYFVNWYVSLLFVFVAMRFAISIESARLKLLLNT